MSRRALAIIALGAGAGLVFACLPELSPLKGAEAAADGGDETSTVAPVNPCGDGFIDEDAGEECDVADASTACIDCKVVCPGVTDDASAHCYYVADGGVTTYQNASVSCPGGHVVTLGSEREARFVDALDAGPYWVGASDDPVLGGFGSAVATEPGFPTDAGCAGCFARRLVQSDAGSGCVVAVDGGWTLTNCSDAGATTICEREPLGVRSYLCGGPICATVKGATKSYVIYLTGALDAEAAAQECARFDGLAVFETREERERVVREIVLRLDEGSLPFEAWIGLSLDGGTWTWDDGVLADDGGRASPWGADQPNTNAGRAFIRINPASFDSQLAQAKDDLPRPFICQRK